MLQSITGRVYLCECMMPLCGTHTNATQSTRIACSAANLLLRCADHPPVLMLNAGFRRKFGSSEVNHQSLGGECAHRAQLWEGLAVPQHHLLRRWVASMMPAVCMVPASVLAVEVLLWASFRQAPA